MSLVLSAISETGGSGEGGNDGLERGKVNKWLLNKQEHIQLNRSQG